MTVLTRLIALAVLLVGLLGTASTAQADAGFESRVLDLANRERASRGLGPLALSGELQDAARGHASAMAGGGFFDHNGPDGSTPASRVEGAGYRGWTFVAENIAAGQRSPEQVMTSWMSSPGHRENLLSPKAREIGIGHVYRPGTEWGHYWVQDLGARRNAPAAQVAAPAGSGCGFTLGFGALREQIPAVVGGCLEDEHHNPENGDGLQRTSGGLLVWRKADNFTAFTDGYRSWVAGPYGLQARLNTERFPWER